MSYVGLYDDAGSKNAFYIIKDKKIGRKRVGFKEFENEQEAQFAHRVQKHLAQFDLAPMVYGDVGMIRRYDGELTCYGYLTEVARPMPECHDDDCDGECFGTDCKNGTTICEVVNSLGEYGLEYIDAHKGNFGYVRRAGSWVAVAIDVGVESFGEWNESIYGEFEDDEDVDSYGSCNCVNCQKFRDRG
jgi:hypothetical protein